MMIDCLDKQRQGRQQSSLLSWHHQQQQQQQQRLPTPQMGAPSHLRFASGSVSSSNSAGQVIQEHQQAALQQSRQRQLDHQPPRHMLADLFQQASASSEVEHDSSILQQQQSSNDKLIGYYFGSISRDTAEWILKNHGNQKDGTYLLRSSGPKDDFVLSLMAMHEINCQNELGMAKQQNTNQQLAATFPSKPLGSSQDNAVRPTHFREVLHYKIVETDDSFVALQGQVGDEKFVSIDELIEKAQGVATKPKWPIMRQELESQILPPTFWGLTIDQIRLAILIMSKQWGFPLSIFHQQLSPSTNPHQQHHQIGGSSSLTGANPFITTLNNETIRTLIYKSLHEFQPWFHGRIGRNEAERRIEEGAQRDGRFLIRERDNYSYAMCISHKQTTKHYRIDVLSTGELAIQDGRKFTSLMALVSHYTLMSDGLWCALTESCARPIQAANQCSSGGLKAIQRGHQIAQLATNNVYCVPPSSGLCNKEDCCTVGSLQQFRTNLNSIHLHDSISTNSSSVRSSTTCRNQHQSTISSQANSHNLQGDSNNMAAIVPTSKAPIKEWLQTINHKWSQLILSKTNQHNQSLNSFLFGSSNPLNNHHSRIRNCRRHHHHHNGHQRRRCKNDRSKILAPNSASNQQRPQREAMLSTACKTLGLAQQETTNGQDCGCNSNGESHSQRPLRESAHHHRPSSGTWQTCRYGRTNGDIGDGRTCGSINRSLQQTSSQIDRQQLGDYHNNQTANQVRAQNYTKALLSCLPQNSGFMLDSQSFIGSPLFAVKTNPQVASNSHVQPFSESFSSGGALLPNRASNLVNAPVGRISSDSGLGGSGGCDIPVEKLISPAQSISTNLNCHQQQNPYALGSDIYNSQTSTTLVKDHHLPTSSSSSSGGNNNNLSSKQRQLSYDLGRPMNFSQQQQMQTNLSSSNQSKDSNNVANRFPVNAKLPTMSSQLDCNASQLERHQDLNIHHQQQQQLRAIDAKQQVGGEQARNFQSQTKAPIKHAGPIVCGQHAGPAYRYTNYNPNEDLLLGPCAHSATFGYPSTRALDDLHLQTASSTQLGGPAALTKFVQFQDGQCLRTHRDTQSIQMAYLMSRKEALNTSKGSGNALNDLTNSTLSTNFNRQFPTKTDCGQTSKQQVAPFYQWSQNGNPQSNSQQASASQTTHLPRPPQQQQQRSQKSDPSDIDLIDCDGTGFQFKYDLKLIKSSSIETLCGAGEVDEQQPVGVEEDISNFKTNRELLMSLQLCWPADNAASATDIFNPLIPTQAAFEPQLKQELPQDFLPQPEIMFNQIAQLDSAATTSNAANTNDPLQPILGDFGLVNHFERFDEDWKNQHDLDEMTTTQLTKLTESLKAQVDMKNKRSGLCSQPPTEPANLQTVTATLNSPKPGNSSVTNGNGIGSETNPLELINEFDSLILKKDR